MAAGTDRARTVVLDVDGTLVDTVYQHTICWAKAFGDVGVDVPAWRLHRAIGMGGDRLVAEVAGQAVEDRYGDAVRLGHDERFDAVISDVRPLPGAAELLAELRRRELKVVLASSGIAEQTQRLLALVDGGDSAHDWTSSEDAEASKPAPDLIQVALDKVQAQPSDAVVVGDAVWDIDAAAKLGIDSIGLRCGGFGEAELRDAGAAEVYDDPQDLLDDLDDSVLAGGA